MSLGNTAAQAPEYRRQMESSASCPRPRTSECSLTANEFTCLMMQVLSGVVVPPGALIGKGVSFVVMSAGAAWCLVRLLRAGGSVRVLPPADTVRVGTT